MDILALLQPIEDNISKTTLQQMSRVILAMTGRVTMLGLARWAGEGVSYRTIQRFYATVIPWAQVLWQFFCQSLFRLGEVYILAGNECVDSKAGKKTIGSLFLWTATKSDPGVIFLCLLPGKREPTAFLSGGHGVNRAQRRRKDGLQSQKGD